MVAENFEIPSTQDEYYRKIWGEVEGHLNQMLEELLDYVNEHFPGLETLAQRLQKSRLELNRPKNLSTSIDIYQAHAGYLRDLIGDTLLDTQQYKIGGALQEECCAELQETIRIIVREVAQSTLKSWRPIIVGLLPGEVQMKPREETKAEVDRIMRLLQSYVEKNLDTEPVYDAMIDLLLEQGEVDLDGLLEQLFTHDDAETVRRRHLQLVAAGIIGSIIGVPSVLSIWEPNIQPEIILNGALLWSVFLSIMIVISTRSIAKQDDIDSHIELLLGKKTDDQLIGAKEKINSGRDDSYIQGLLIQSREIRWIQQQLEAVSLIAEQLATIDLADVEQESSLRHISIENSEALKVIDACATFLAENDDISQEGLSLFDKLKSGILLYVCFVEYNQRQNALAEVHDAIGRVESRLKIEDVSADNLLEEFSRLPDIDFSEEPLPSQEPDDGLLTGIEQLTGMERGEA